MKLKTAILIFAIFEPIFTFSLFSFELYDGKKLQVDMTLILGVDYSYKATLLPGIGGFELTNSQIKIEGEYLENLEFSFSGDFSDTEIESEQVHFLKNAYLQYNFFYFLRLRTGRFDIPFGGEADLGIGSRPYIYHSEASKLITPGRSIGVSLSGKKIFDYFGYKVGFFNSSGDLFTENVTGHHIFTGLITFKKGIFEAGYNILYSTDETFSQGVFIDINALLRENITFRFFTEYLEQRYFNYHWNHSVYSFASLRVNSFEPVLYFDYYNDRVGYDGVEDKWIPGIGFNVYFLNDKLKLMTDLHTNYLYSLEDGYNLKFYDHKLTIKLILEI